MTEAPGRFPLPAVAIGALALVVVQGPLLFTPAMLQEPALLDGSLTLSGWLPGALLWRWVEGPLGLGVTAHRILGLGLEVLVLFALAAWPLRGRSRSLVVLAGLAYLLHPLHAEVMLRLPLRPLLVAELLLVTGGALALRRSWVARAIGALALASGAAAVPTIAVFALPLALATASRPAGLVAAGAMVLGALTRLFVPVAVLPLHVALAGPPLLLRPDRIGGTAPIPETAWPSALGLAVLALGLVMLTPRERRREQWGGTVVCALACIGAPLLRPDRPDLAGLEATATPDLFLPLLAALLWMTVRAGDRGWRRAPLFFLVFVSLVTGWMQRGALRDETAWLDRTVDLDPSSAFAHTTRARSSLREAQRLPTRDAYGRYEQALRDADTSLRLQRQNLEAGQLRCLALVGLGKFAEAREECDRWIAAFPDRASPLFLRGEIEWKSGETIEALRWLRAAGNHPDAKGRVGPFFELLDQVYAEIAQATKEREPAEVREVCRRLVAALPGEVRAREALANTYTLEGDLEQAIVEFQKVLEYDASSEVALKALITLYESVGRPEESQPYRRRLLEVAGRDAFE